MASRLTNGYLKRFLHLIRHNQVHVNPKTILNRPKTTETNNRSFKPGHITLGSMFDMRIFFPTKDTSKEVQDYGQNSKN